MSQLPAKSSRYAEFGSNNIVIVPTVSLENLPKTTLDTANMSSVQTTKTANITTKTVTENSSQIKPNLMDLEKTKHVIPLKKIPQHSPSLKIPLKDVNKNITEDLDKTKKASWASNYLQSIGHNNIKPIKINLSRNKKNETVLTKSVETNNVPRKLLQNSTTYNEPKNLTTTYPKEKIIDKHIGIKNNAQSAVCLSNLTTAPVEPRIDIVTSSVSSPALNTIHGNNNNIIAPVYGNGGERYCHNNVNYEIDILDAIKSKINWESMQHNKRTMNLPTHKDMCEEFIKEISTKPSTSSSGKKRDQTVSPTKMKLKKCLSKLDTKAKKLVKTHMKDIKESLKTITKHKSAKDKVKNVKSALKAENARKSEKKLTKDKIEYKNQQHKKSIIDLNDFDILTKEKAGKDAENKLKIDNPASERQKLKRARTISDEINKSISSSKSDKRNVKSAAVKTEKCQDNTPKRQRLEIKENFDLRSKLSRDNKKTLKKQLQTDYKTKVKQQESLNITVANQKLIKSPKKSQKLKNKKNKCRKLKLIINVVCQESDDETSSSDSNMSETTPTQNMDLSFLDDFNVDEIVDSLKHSPKRKAKSPSHEGNITENNETTTDPHLKLTTILNMLQAKSESNMQKQSVKTEYNYEDITSNSSKSNRKNLQSTTKDKKEECKMQSETNQKIKIDSNTHKDATNDLIKMLSHTKSKQEQRKSTTPANEPAFTERNSPKIDFNVDVMTVNQGEQLSEDIDTLIIDKSVIINESDVSIVDLTNETLLPVLPEVQDDSIEAISMFIQSEMQNIKVDSLNVTKDENDNFKPDITLVTVSSDDLSLKSSDEKCSNVATSKIKVQPSTLENNDDVIFIDLTEDSLNGNIHGAVEQSNTNSQKQVNYENKLKQEINLKPSTNEGMQIINKKADSDEKSLTLIKKTPIDLDKNIKQKNDKTTNNTNERTENKSGVVKSNNNMNTVKEINDINIKNTENPVAENNNKAAKIINEANIKNTEKANENLKKPVTGIDNNNKVFETTVAKRIIKNIVDSVWDTKTDVEENVSKTNSPKDKIVKPAKETKTQLEHPKSNNLTAEKKLVTDKILSCELKALAVLLEKRMLDYLHKEIKVIDEIHQGKYSDIIKCKDTTTGEFYAAKILRVHNNRYERGIQKEQMIRQLQQDIPRENINTVYVIDGFGINNQWCLLTEYYPKNLKQVFMEQKKPFHIDVVQDLTRQLMSALMVLRNNEIVHSDIKPSHILMNSAHNRLKLCGFDDAYCGNDVYPLPNIGTSSYRAPEIILGFSASYSIDIWSSALVIYQMTTNESLFSGIFNNDILFKQMCLFGSLPRNMVNASPYKNNHFQGSTFMRRVGFKGQDAVLYPKFYKTKRLHMSLIAAYSKYWVTKAQYQRNSDLFKMDSLHKLLEQMLQLDPRVRIAIEFVCADPFIFEMYS